MAKKIIIVTAVLIYLSFFNVFSCSEKINTVEAANCKTEFPQEQYTERRNVKQETTNNLVITESLSMQDEEKDSFYELLCKITYAESGLEDEIGQVAVAATILNRIENDDFPETLEEVINQKGAFSSVHDGEIYIMCEEPYVVEYENIPDITKTAVERAINGEDPTEDLLQEEANSLGLDEKEFSSGGSLFFYNPKVCSEAALDERACIQVKIQIGNHIFYKVWG